MRLFFALRIPEPSLSAVCSIQKQLQTRCQTGNFTRRENLHMTLAFLGETAPQRLPELRKIAERCAEAVPPFSLRLDRIGEMPGRAGEKLFYLAGEAPPELQSLVSALYAGLRNADYTLEERAFLPHVTLGRRCRLRPGEDSAELPFPAVCVPIGTLFLMQSAREDGRLLYTPLASSAFCGRG